MENTAIAAGQTDMPVVPADGQIAKLKAEVAALRAMIFTNGDRNMTMEDRTFTVMEDGFIADNNFDFDAGLRLTGDFVDDEKRKYAEMIADVLNRHNVKLTGDPQPHRRAPSKQSERG